MQLVCGVGAGALCMLALHAYRASLACVYVDDYLDLRPRSHVFLSGRAARSGWVEALCMYVSAAYASKIYAVNIPLEWQITFLLYY